MKFNQYPSARTRLQNSAAAVVEQLEGRKLLASSPLYTEPFDEAPGATTGLLNGPSASGQQWRTYQPNGGVAVNAEKLRVQNTGGFTSWYTSPLNIAGQGPVDLSIDLTGTNIGPNDLARFVYSVDGGAQQQFAFTRGQSGSLTATATGITGSTLKVEVQLQAVQGQYTLDNFTVRTGAIGDEVDVQIANRILKISGTAEADKIRLTAPIVIGSATSDQRLYTLMINDQSAGTFNPDDFDAILIDSGGGTDDIYVMAGGVGDRGDSVAEPRPVTILAGDGPDTVFANAAGGEVRGGGGDDDIAVRTVVAYGEGGNDRITAADRTSNTVIAFGGAGNDVFDFTTIGGAENVAANIDGGDGDDQVIAGFNLTGLIFKGGSGNDTVTASQNDAVSGTTRPFDIDGGEGNDDIEIGINGSNVTLRGGLGNDRLVVTVSESDRSATLLGGDGDDVIFSQAGGRIEGGAGNDIINTTGGSTSDQRVVLGDAGNDTLRSGRGQDAFAGGAGNDTVDYRGRTDGPFTVSFDNVANDGATGEGDNIRSDVENALGATVVGQTATNLFTEPFDEASGANSGNLTGGGQWRTYLGAGSAPALQQRLRVADGKLLASNTGGFVSWFTSPLNIAGKGPVDLSLDLTGTNIGPNDLARFVYSVDGGAQQQFAFTRGTNGSLTATASGITGSTLKVEVQLQALQGQYTLDNFAVRTAGVADGVSAEILDRVLIVTGTAGDDDVEVRGSNFFGNAVYDVLVDGEVVEQFDAADFDRVELLGLDGNDKLRIFGGLRPEQGSYPQGARDVFVDGGAGADDVFAQGRSGEVRGGIGDDTVVASENVPGYGDAGNDTMGVNTTQPERFTELYGGEGNDTLDGRSDSESGSNLYGGPGDDTLIGQNGTGFGEGGNDTIRMFVVNNGLSAFADGGDGDDDLTVSVSASNAGAGANGGAGNDTIRVSTNGNRAIVRGGSGNDLIITTGFLFEDTTNLVLGGDGDDTLISGTGADDFTGGPGNDAVDYRGRTDGPFTVFFDNVANDGAEGEGDNIRDDVEIVLGTDSPPQFVQVITNDFGIVSIIGTDGDDVISLGYSESNGMSTISANGSMIYSSVGNDFTTLELVDLRGGNDRYFDGLVSNTDTEVLGGAGNDTAYISNGVFRGVAGDDTMYTFQGEVAFFGDAGNDRVVADYTLIDLPTSRSTSVYADGGDGDDVFEFTNRTVNRVSTTLLGGAGNDTLLQQRGDDGSAAGDDANTSDDFSGGAGIDTVDYRPRNSTSIEVSFDNVANDGAKSEFVNENDNIRDDVENVLGATVVGQPSTELASETFDEANGATTGNFDGVGTWRTYRGGANFSVQDGAFVARQTDGFRTWYTNRFDISGGPVDVSIDLASTGVLGDFDRLNVLVRVDGGPAQTLAQLRNRFDDFTAILAGLSGSTLQIEIQANINLDLGTYAWDNIQVSRA